MKIAGIQFACSGDKEKNTEIALRILDFALKEGAKIVCFQELFTVPWFPRNRDELAFDLAETVDGETITLFREKARESDVVLVVPFFERSGNAFFNSCAIIGADGQLLGVYRKVHIPDIPLWEEKYYFSRGDQGFPVFDTGFGTIGIQISWDNLYPEVSRILALKGAEIIFAPTACAFQTQGLWQTVISANAIANGLYVMRVNRVGSEAAQDFYGMSFCVNGEGELVGGPTAGADSVLLADADLERLKNVRREWPIMKERQPKLYKDILREARHGK